MGGVKGGFHNLQKQLFNSIRLIGNFKILLCPPPSGEKVLDPPLVLYQSADVITPTVITTPVLQIVSFIHKGKSRQDGLWMKEKRLWPGGRLSASIA